MKTHLNPNHVISPHLTRLSSDKRTLTWENGRSEGIRKGQVKSAAMALMAMKMVLMGAITNKEAHLDMIMLMLSTSGVSRGKAVKVMCIVHGDNDGDGGDSEYDHVLFQFHW